MVQKMCAITLLMMFVLTGTVLGQNPYGQLDPKPYDPAVDADIDHYLVNWRESPPKHTHGSLIEQEILRRRKPSSLETGGFCSHCGTPIQAGDRFCINCGTKVQVAETEA